MRRAGFNRYGNPIERETVPYLVAMLRAAAQEYRTRTHERGGTRPLNIIRAAARRLLALRAGGVGKRIN